MIDGSRVSEETLTRLAEGEHHFNVIQGGLRALASTWTLAAFAGIAVLLKQTTEFNWLPSPFFLAVLVCVMATVGLLALWVIDQLVFQRLLNSVFLVGLKTEYDCKDVPPVRAMMAASSEGKGMSYWLRVFYLAPMLRGNRSVSMRSDALGRAESWRGQTHDRLRRPVLIWVLPVGSLRSSASAFFTKLLDDDGQAGCRWLLIAPEKLESECRKSPKGCAPDRPLAVHPCDVDVMRIRTVEGEQRSVSWFLADRTSEKQPFESILPSAPSNDGQTTTEAARARHPFPGLRLVCRPGTGGADSRPSLSEDFCRERHRHKSETRRRRGCFGRPQKPKGRCTDCAEQNHSVPDLAAKQPRWRRVIGR